MRTTRQQRAFMLGKALQMAEEQRVVSALDYLRERIPALHEELIRDMSKVAVTTILNAAGQEGVK